MNVLNHITGYKAALLFTLVSWILYGSTIHFEFTLDDTMYTSKNLLVTSEEYSVLDAFTHSHTYGFSGVEDQGYRPITVVAFRVLYTLFGDSPKGYHVINIFMYALLLFGIFNLFKTDFFKLKNTAVLAGTLVFAILPVHVEVVANCKGLEDLLQSTFSVWGLFFLLTHLEKENKTHLYSALLLLLFGSLSKETGLIAPGIGGVIYRLSSPKRRNQFQEYFGLAIIIGLVLIARSTFSGQSGLLDIDPINNILASAESYQERFITALYWQLLYVVKLLVPFTLLSDYGIGTLEIIQPVHPEGLAAILFALSSIFAIGISLKKDSIVFTLLLWYGAAMLLTSNIVVLIGAGFADRFLFFSSIPAVFIGVKLLQKVEPLPKYGKFLISVMVLLYASQTYNRIPAWKNNLTLFETDVQASPSNAKLNAFYAMELRDSAMNAATQMASQNLLINAEHHFIKALEAYPKYTDARYNLGVMYQQTGRIEQAKQAYLQALSHFPDHALSNNNLGLILFNEGNNKEAIEHFRIAYSFAPTNIEILSNHALSFQLEGENDSARFYYEKVLKLNPNHTIAKTNLKTLTP